MYSCSYTQRQLKSTHEPVTGTWGQENPCQQPFHY